MKTLLTLAAILTLSVPVHADDIYLKKSVGHGQFAYVLMYRIDNMKNFKQRTVWFTSVQACLREYQRIRQNNVLRIIRMQQRGEKG